MSITLEAGKFYRSRDGKKYGPMRFTGPVGSIMQWSSPEAFTWATTGQHCMSRACPMNLVAEWTDEVVTADGPQVAETPEWAQQVEAEATEERAPDIKSVIADEAKRIVSGARRSAYGKPEQNFERIARFWNVYLVNVGLLPVEALRDPDAHGISAKDVSPMMRLMKEARLCETPDHYDSFVDMAGYTLTGAEVNGVTKPA